MKLLLPVVCSLILAGCNQSSEPAAQTTAEPAAATVVETTQPEANTSLPEVAVPETTVEKAPEEVKKTAPEKPAPAAEKKPVIKEAPAKTEVKKTVKKEPEAVAIDGSALYKKCSSCHGNNAEKAALGKSAVIAGWSEGQIVDALKGYQAGTYGKETKALMQGQAKSLSDEEIHALARHISKL